jgi:threonine dehydrogenase-like Zn-dependent dehydrogenase
VKAIKFLGKNRVAIVQIPRPKPRGDVVIIKVTASGICGTDLELLLPQENEIEIIPGHEVVGIVAEVDKVKYFKPGDRVMVNCHVTCGQCEYCRSGDVIFCPELNTIGFEIDGGDAEYLAVPETSIRPIPDDISDEMGVIVGDTLGTPYHAVKKAGINAGETVGVFGAGPLGQMAVFAAKSKSAHVVAVDLSEQRLKEASGFGAEFLLNPAKVDPLDRIQELTKGKGLDKAIECAGSALTMITALDSLKMRGRLVQVGVCPHVELDTFKHIVKKEIEIIGSRNFNNYELDEILNLARSNPQIVQLVSHQFPLDRAGEAFETARQRKGNKILIRP